MPSTLRWRPGQRLGPVQLLGQRPQQDVVDQGRLARARHAGHRDQAAEREGHVDVVQVVLAGAPHRRRPRRCPDAAAPAPGSTSSPRGTGPVMEALLASSPPRPVDRSRVHDVAAVLTGTGADVDDVVGRRGSSPRRARPR